MKLEIVLLIMKFFKKMQHLTKLKVSLLRGNLLARMWFSHIYKKKLALTTLKKPLMNLIKSISRLLQYASAQSYDFSTEFIQKFTTHEDADIAATAKETIKNRSFRILISKKFHFFGKKITNIIQLMGD